MSRLLEAGPYAARDDEAFLAEMNSLTAAHLGGCPAYRSMWPTWTSASTVEQLPYVHVGVFKQLLLRTDRPGIEHQRVLLSSATSGTSSRIALDERSSSLQAASSQAILEAAVGSRLRPLLVVEDARNLRRRGEVTARIAAAMSLRPLASDIHFLLEDTAAGARICYDRLGEILARQDDLLVYGFTWMLWLAWAEGQWPDSLREALRGKRICFVHSGGWKKLESLNVDRSTFNRALLCDLHPESRVVDCYGLVEQVGVLFPLCEHGFRHVPRWADVIVRDPWTLAAVRDRPGMLQLLNVLTHGAPYHSVLTEDLGRFIEGECPCGWSGRRFELLGRVPKAEVRGCANV
jgi:hypothetical protein